MFQKIFYSNNPLQYWIVVLLGLFGMILNLLYVEQDASINCFVFHELFSDIIIKAKYAVVLSYVFLFVSTLELMQINKMLSDNLGILLPSVVLTLFLNILFPSLYLIIGIIILPAFIFITKLLINVSERERIFSELFYIGFISGFITMINFDFVIILLIVCIGLAILRPFYFKEYMVLLISFLLPYIMLDSVIFFFFDTHLIRLLNIKNIYSFNYSVPSSSLFTVLVFIIFTIFVYIRILNKKVELKTIKSRKIFIWINSSIFLVWIWMFFSYKLLLIYLLALLLSISFSVVLMSLPKQIYPKLLLTILFILNVIIFMVI